MSQLGIDKGTKDKGLGYYIILYCLSLGQAFKSKGWMCILILRTTKKLTEKYHGPRYNFKWDERSDKETV